MTQEEITRAFDNRWRVYGNTPAAWVKGVRELCRDFFEAGILIASTPADCPVCCRTTTTVTTSQDTSFSTWWNLYDKKIDRGKCEKKWAKLTEEERRACIAATPDYVASTPDIQYRRHPMTYLNNKSWENQIIPHSNATKPTIEQQRLDKLASILTD